MLCLNRCGRIVDSKVKDFSEWQCKVDSDTSQRLSMALDSFSQFEPDESWRCHLGIRTWVHLLTWLVEK